MRGRGTDHFTLDKANVLFDAYMCVFWVYPHIWRSGSQEPSTLPLRGLRQSQETEVHLTHLRGSGLRRESDTWRTLKGDGTHLALWRNV